MARTDKFREQHDEMLAIAGELKKLLVVADLARDGTAARSCLGRLMGKLRLHLGVEDQVLYPDLCNSKDAALASLANRFANEMKTTVAVVTRYNDSWPTPSAIKANPAGFVAETEKIIKALADRIRRENQELYVAADKAAAKA